MEVIILHAASPAADALSLSLELLLMLIRSSRFYYKAKQNAYN